MKIESIKEGRWALFFFEKCWGSMIRESFGTLLPSILAEYHRGHDLNNVPVKVDLLRPMIEARGVVDRIILEEFYFDSNHVIANVKFFKGQSGVYCGDTDYARIQYSSALNICWKRFAVCKEMYHCVIDTSMDGRVSDVRALTKLSELLVSGVGAAIHKHIPLETEKLAELLALETLMPYELRLFHFDDYKSGGITSHQLALRYRIPESYVKMAMYDSYNDLIRELRSGNFVSF